MTIATCTKTFGFLSGVALVALSAVAPAVAGDFNGSAPRLKGSYGHRVAHVPAPAPVPDYEPQYYLGLHGSFAFHSSGDIEGIETGPSGTSIANSGFADSVQDHGDTSNLVSGGFSIGRYVSRNVRGEVSFDFRPRKSVATGSSEYQTTVIAEGPAETVVISPAIPPILDAAGNVVVPGQQAITQDYASVDSHVMDVSRQEQAKFTFQTGMVNAYYDFHNRSRFTPFIGAGAGLVLYNFQRTVSETSECRDTTNTFTNPTDGSVRVTDYGNNVCVRPPDVDDIQETRQGIAWGYALNVMAGVSVDLTESVKFDMGYRFLYTSGNVSVGLPTALGGTTAIDIKDRVDNEVRVGLRWDIH
ncbi:MAG: hypothetical protein AAFY53_09395 [Pseudomonadota bacterium]